jgi:hypothetical protein
MLAFFPMHITTLPDIRTATGKYLSCGAKGIHGLAAHCFSFKPAAIAFHQHNMVLGKGS